MRLIRGLYNLPHFERGCALTIGNFDGCHRGHQTILSHLKLEATKRNIPSVVLIFEPQPNEYFAPNSKTPARLMRLRDKVRFMQQTNIDYLLCMRFNQELATCSPQQFIHKTLIDALNIKFLAVGDDFHFGYQRKGNFTTLQQAANKFNFDVQDNQSFIQSEQRISSTLIRTALAEDDLITVEKMLGRTYSVHGRVVHGKKLGRTIGFPTANIFLKRKVIPVEGVYAIEVILDTKQHYYGVANVGNRPTLDGISHPLLEAHLFDFEGNLYGYGLEIVFRKKLRSEIKFPSLNALTQQIQHDAQQAKLFFYTNLVKERSDGLHKS